MKVLEKIVPKNHLEIGKLISSAENFGESN